MMVTNLDEAIQHCLEVAEENERLASFIYIKEGNPYYENYIECAKEHRQLAEWLKELKAYREQLPHEITETKKRQARTLEVNVANEVYNPYLAEFVKGYICALSFVEGIIAKIIEEVNADDDIHS